MSNEMQPTITYGRRPTLGEVRAYYCRDPFLDLLLQVCQTRRVVMAVPPGPGSWKPDWDNDRIRGASRADLRAFILSRINRDLPGLDDSDRPPFYPSFHFTVEYWRPGEVDTSPSLGSDAVAETDLPTWRESFEDLMAGIHALRQANVAHRLKFSGHRSLHLLVPSGGNSLPVSQVADHGVDLSMLRLPYSLNEDTGLVSLPLSWERLHTFRPWQANLHLVTIRGDWLRAVNQAERERTHRFVDNLEERRIAEVRGRFEPADDLDDLRAWVTQHIDPNPREAGAPAAPSPLATAWRWVCGVLPVTAEQMRTALGHKDPDVRWLTAEAYLLHGTCLPEDLVVKLMADDDLYVRSTALDIIARFADPLTDWLLDRLTTDSLDGWTATATVLAHNAWQRGATSAVLIRRLDDSPMTSAEVTALGRLACVIGVAYRFDGNSDMLDWPAAWSLVHKADEAGHNSPEWTLRRRALALIAEMANPRRHRSQVSLAEELAALGPAVTDLLLLESVALDPHLSRALLIALSLGADKRAIDTFVRSLADRHRHRAKWASRALLQLGEHALPALLEATRDSHPRRRRYAIRCLRHLADPRFREAIRDGLKSDDDTVCHQAVIAIRPIVRVEDVALLKQVVRNRRWYTRREGVVTLAALGARGRDAITELAQRDGEPTSAGWLWRHGDNRALAIVLAGLGGGPDVRRAAAWQLGDGPLTDRLADQAIDCVLAMDLDDEDREPPDWTSLPLDLFVRFRHRPRAFALFDKLCGSENGWDHHLAAKTLGRWTGPNQGRAVALLVSMLHDHQRRDARNALVVLGPDCLPAVQAARDDAPDPASRQRLEAAVNDLEVCRQAETGGGITPAFLAAASRTTAGARDRVAVAFRERDRAAVLSTLASALAHDHEPVRQGGRDLLGRMGEVGRRTIARARDHAPQGVAQQEMDRFLAKLAKEGARLDETVSRP